MKRERFAIASLAVLALFVAATCQSTRTVVAKVATPTPVPTRAPGASSGPATPQSSLTATPLPVVSAAPSIYDRTPGVLYEQTAPPTPSSTRPQDTAPGQSAPPPRPTWTASAPTATRPTSTRVPTQEPTAGRTTPTQKPGAYYEPAVTWTPTPGKN